jgi:hypothetical protein
VGPCVYGWLGGGQTRQHYGYVNVEERCDGDGKQADRLG